MVVVLGILAAIVVPQYTDASQDARRASVAGIVRSVRNKLDEQFARASAWPATIDPAWFASQQVPAHPENQFGVPSVQIESTAGKTHPTDKVLKAGVGGAFWYNPTNGAFRARVADQGSDARTLDAYNFVNQAVESSTGNYSTGGSGGGSVS
ncbi:MAG: hypothetical protein AMXMBFR13_30410 [Phycisphaerae bacterium]